MLSDVGIVVAVVRAGIEGGRLDAGTVRQIDCGGGGGIAGDADRDQQRDDGGTDAGDGVDAAVGELRGGEPTDDVPVAGAVDQREPASWLRRGGGPVRISGRVIRASGLFGSNPKLKSETIPFFCGESQSVPNDPMAMTAGGRRDRLA